MYKILIIKRVKVTNTEREYRKVLTNEQVEEREKKDPSGVTAFDYVEPADPLKEEEITILEQEVETLDLKSVICAINGLPIPRKK